MLRLNAVGQEENVAADDVGVASLERRRKQLLTRAQPRGWIAMTIDAPTHFQRLSFAHQSHIAHRAVAGGATDALCEMDTMVKIDVIGYGSDAGPTQRAAGLGTDDNRLQHRGVAEYLGVARETGLSGRQARERRSLR